MSTWTRDQITGLRNKAAARVQLAAPVVKEVEELTTLIEHCDALLSSSPTPVHGSLLALRPIDGREPVDRPDTSNVAVQQAILDLLEKDAGKGILASNIARELDKPYGSVAPALKRMLDAKLIRKIERGLYACID